MEDKRTYDAVLMGDESLLVHGGEAWLGRGHGVVAVVTESREIEVWAEKRGLRVLRPDDELPGLLRGMRFDVLLSLANLRGIPEALLGLARRGVIHYHDGPFPRFAGAHPTTWAILEGAMRYGITWLRANVEGEAEVLLTRSFELSPDETALSLNTRCHAAAVESFGELVEALERDALTALPIDETPRRYYERTRRPWALGHLDFTRPAKELAALVRALDFGAYPNPITVPKVTFAGEVLRVAGAEALEESVAGEPGEVIRETSSHVDVITGRGVLRLSRLSSLDGRAPRRLPEVGERLESPPPAVARELDALGLELVAHEAGFSRRLADATPVSLRLVGPDTGAAEWRALPLGEGADASRPEWIAALTTLVSRLASRAHVSLAFADEHSTAFWRRAPAHLSARLPLSVAAPAEATFGDVARAARRELEELSRAPGFARDLLLREPRIERPELPIGVTFGESPEERGEGLALELIVDGRGPRFEVDVSRVDLEVARSLAARLEMLLAAGRAHPERSLGALPSLTDEERDRVLAFGRGPDVPIPEGTLVEAFEAMVDRSPDAPALVAGGESLTYRELDELANGVAHALVAEELSPRSIVGLAISRSAALVYGALGIMKAGHAYLPLDPAYPEARLRMMLEDSEAPVILVDEGSAHLAHGSRARALEITSRPVRERVRMPRRAEDLAYVIYTSGSTGKPKGVMVEHRNVQNFFVGMDERVPHEQGEGRVWLAVTSLSFDISVLELFYTLTRGFTVVLASNEDRVLMNESRGRPIDFGLYYWGNDGGRGREKYRLLLEGAKIADRSGFNAVWTPERHFHAFGGPYPNPAVTGAAVAAVTKNVDVRAGSCVLPLHHPARVAEEWAVVDNLTQGRVGVAFASGWQPDDFVLRPENAPPKHRAALLEGMETVRRLWRGEAVAFPKGDGTPHETVTMPRPMQAELPVWLTTAGNPQTWIDAARAGAHVLTHLLGQSIAEVGEKVAIYREALAAAGRDPRAYRVTLMLHTFVAESREDAAATVEGPLKDYLKSAAGLIKNYAWSFPAFKRPEGVTDAASLDLSSLDPDEMEGVLDYAFHRYFEDSGLFGTEHDCLARVAEVRAIGVDEIACLVDFGIDTDTALAGIERLARVVREVKARDAESREDRGIAAAIRRHGVSHLQCTPSMARMLLEHVETRGALAQVRHLFLGGEALQGSLVRALREAAPSATIENMYGPTETTVWSSTTAAEANDEVVPIGRAIANTQLYVLDERGGLLAPGFAGELHIGGEGVTRGYLGRPELTAERFVPDPFTGHGRLYRTGDLVRAREDGTIDFLGRVDHQVKIRGHRIELGEIEARVLEVPRVREAVLVAREDRPGDVRLVAYYTSDGEVSDDEIRAHLASSLPSFMVPGHVIPIERFPLTPNAKIDRKALPKPEEAARSTVAFVAPTSELEEQIVEVYRELFGLPRVGTGDDFFALGGHSLLAVQAHRKLAERLAVSVGVTDIFRFPVVAELARHLSGQGDSGGALAATKERAGMRRKAMLKRRDASRSRS